MRIGYLLEKDERHKQSHRQRQRHGQSRTPVDKLVLYSYSAGFLLLISFWTCFFSFGFLLGSSSQNKTKVIWLMLSHTNGGEKRKGNTCRSIISTVLLHGYPSSAYYKSLFYVSTSLVISILLAVSRLWQVKQKTKMDAKEIKKKTTCYYIRSTGRRKIPLICRY